MPRTPTTYGWQLIRRAYGAAGRQGCSCAQEVCPADDGITHGDEQAPIGVCPRQSETNSGTPRALAGRVILGRKPATVMVRHQTFFRPVRATGPHGLPLG